MARKNVNSITTKDQTGDIDALKGNLPMFIVIHYSENMLCYFIVIQKIYVNYDKL
jgi:hypothetical protein